MTTPEVEGYEDIWMVRVQRAGVGHRFVMGTCKQCGVTVGKPFFDMHRTWHAKLARWLVD